MEIRLAGDFCLNNLVELSESFIILIKIKTECVSVKFLFCFKREGEKQINS